jgi:Zn-dependent protease
LAGAFAAVACAVVWWQTGNPLWAALARAGAWLNILNLIPVWMLDGGQAALALSKTHRFILLTACVGLWIISGENVFFLVALGALWRIFTKDLPPKPTAVTIVYYLAVLAVLAIVVSTMPGQGFGPS